MNLNSKRIMSFGFCILVFSCNPNSADDSSTKKGPPIGSLNNREPGKTTENKVCQAVDQMQSTGACQTSNALQYQCSLPQGKDSAECKTVITLTSTTSSVYDYLNLAKEAYKNAYYASNIDIIAIAKRILNSQSPEEICRLSIQSLNALDSVQKNFVDPYGYLKDVYDRFLLASQATKEESCLGGK